MTSIRRAAGPGCGQPAYAQTQATGAPLTRSVASPAPVKDGEVHIIWEGPEATRCSLGP